MKINKIIEKNNKFSLSIGNTPEPFDDNSALLTKVIKTLKEELNAQVLISTSDPIIVEIKGHKFGLFCDDLMPLGIYPEDSKSNDLIDIIENILQIKLE